MSHTPWFTIRDAVPGDLPFLREMLFEAVYWRTDVARPEFNGRFACSETENVLAGWGRAGDTAVVAERSTRDPMGAAWYRFWTPENHSYGFVAADVPEVGIGVDPDNRGRGLGTAMLDSLIQIARKQQIRALSLSVQSDNPAVRLYRRIGFEHHSQSSGAYTMVLAVNTRPEAG